MADDCVCGEVGQHIIQQTVLPSRETAVDSILILYEQFKPLARGVLKCSICSIDRSILLDVLHALERLIDLCSSAIASIDSGSTASENNLPEPMLRHGEESQNPTVSSQDHTNEKPRVVLGRGTLPVGEAISVLLIVFKHTMLQMIALTRELHCHIVDCGTNDMSSNGSLRTHSEVASRILISAYLSLAQINREVKTNI